MVTALCVRLTPSTRSTNHLCCRRPPTLCRSASGESPAAPALPLGQLGYLAGKAAAQTLCSQALVQPSLVQRSPEGLAAFPQH